MGFSNLMKRKVKFLVQLFFANNLLVISNVDYAIVNHE